MMPLPHHRIVPGEERLSSPSSSVKPRKQALKVSIVREEFVELTGDPLVAIVLNQLFYWTQRVKDFDLLLEEERKLQPECNVSPRHGWIYKTADELNDETMLRVSRPTMRKYLKTLVEQGWVDERPNPYDKWNKTTQYRVNLKKLQHDLLRLGYALPGYSLAPLKQESDDLLEPVTNHRLEGSNDQDVSSANPDCLKENYSPSSINVPSKEENLPLLEKTLPSKERNLTSYTYTETTTETKNKEHTQRTRVREEFKNFFEEVLEVWETYVGQEALQLTEVRKYQLQSILSHYFQNDVQKWTQFCERIKASCFLMGKGPRKWHVTLDWILDENNLLKVLEGNFDESKIHDQKKTEIFKENRDKERTAILDSIADPLWKEWCSQLDFDLQSPRFVSVGNLKAIAKVRFLETEDDRLVWIGSSDVEALNHVENLRLELLSIVGRTFPNVRNIRTRLDKDPSSSGKPATHTPNNPNSTGAHYA